MEGGFQGLSVSSATTSPSFQATFLFSLSKYTPLKYNNIYVYPPWGYSIGWFLALSSMVCVPLFVIITLLKTQGSFKKVGAGGSDTRRGVSEGGCRQDTKGVAQL